MSYLLECCYEHYKNSTDDDNIMFICYPVIVCKICGNKRCQKANDCTLQCTNSNDMGQAGSMYGGLRVIAESNHQDQRPGQPIVNENLRT